MPRYNTYRPYIKEKLGYRVNKLSVDMGFTCPNRDGNLAVGGCVYCNNDSFVPPYARARFSMDQQITNGMDYLRKRFKAEKFIVYFQSYTNTYDSVEKLEEMYRNALKYEDVIGIAVGTRSDCIDEEKISMFEELAKDYYVSLEFGIESIYDKTLEFMNRGHDYQSVLDAIEMSKGRGFEIGAHIIVGMPTETKEEMLAMAGEVSSLGIDVFKVHNLHIVRNTPLARMYKKEPFSLFNFEEYIDFIIEFLERLSPDMVVERLFTDTPHQLLIAPDWGKSHLQILQAIEAELERKDTYQGRLYQKSA
ncbi:MAG: TIGR01212 family radical SAM protein [Candidatus Dadabacteria bacterium]|jgi:radical SAM protein (TIGR01212 family)|nr:TIGR01212 family radical SAM protein [Candidatus Dadabacteria bacterium]MCZ6685626.1 TIGR01212 family radical SAM protein [Candidatus Dadabacteria bacterium]